MNRRMTGGPRGGNRPSFSQQAFHSGGGVNPWQGGGSNANQGGIISQLTSNPQLALALTSLLQPQQQQQPPSLLSLNTSPAFSGGRDYGRFNRGRDFRRHEPYSKNRIGDRRKKSPKRGGDKKKNEKKVDKKVKDENDSTVEEGADDEKKESKRDWKDEKNQAEGKESGDEGEGKKEGEAKEGKYVGVPNKLLNCFVCNKQMWDGESMSKHVRGRAHHEMLKALEESIHICVNILRENLRLAEERKMIEYNRQGRQRKFSQRREPPLSHCAMCDLKFMGKIISHRRTDGHQRLKRYLHPTCRICDKEYPSRIEWVEHCLTPEHLKRVHESTENKVGGKDGDEITTGDGEYEESDLEPLLEESLQMEGEDPILEADANLDNMVNRLPAYKRDRPLAVGSLKEFSGYRCELCNRSFAEKDDADAHLKTKRHFYRFIEFIKERFDREEKRKKAEKEAEKKKKEEEEKLKAEKAENGVKEEGDGGEGGEEEGDQEMYDPAEATEEDKVNGEGEGAEEEEESSEQPADNQMDTTTAEEVEPEPEPEPEPEIKKEEVKKEPPATPRATPRKVGGPKSKRGKK